MKKLNKRLTPIAAASSHLVDTLLGYQEYVDKAIAATFGVPKELLTSTATTGRVPRKRSALPYPDLMNQLDADLQNHLTLGHRINAHKIPQTFKPIEEFLRRVVETGDIEVTEKGYAVIKDEQDGYYYPLVPAFNAMCDTFDKLAERFHWTPQPPGLRQMTKKIEVHMPLVQSDIDRTRETMEWMKENIRTITPIQFSEEAIDIQIRDEMTMLIRGTLL